MHPVLHSRVGGGGASTCNGCQAHRHISELLLLGTTDRQFSLETTLIMGFGDTVFPCFSFLPDGHQGPKEKTLYSFFSVDISSPLASAITQLHA